MARSGASAIARRETRARAALRRAVVAIAALASIATSQPRWHIEAPIPPAASGGAKTVRVAVEASRAPAVTAERGGRTISLAPEGSARGAAWTGAGDYLVPAGATLKGVSLTDTCSGGGLCSECKPPPSTFVRIVRAWRSRSRASVCSSPATVSVSRARTPNIQYVRCSRVLSES